MRIMQLGSMLTQWNTFTCWTKRNNIFTWQHRKTDVPKGETQTDWRERSEVSTRQDGRNRKLRRTKKEKKKRQKLEERLKIFLCIPCITKIFCMHWNQYKKQRGASVLTYPKILVIESRRPPAGWESRLLKEGRTDLNLVKSFSK